MALTQEQVSYIQVPSDVKLTKVRITGDWTDPGDPTPPVEKGTIVEAYLASDEDSLVVEGEAWYAHPVTGESWLTLPDYFEVVSE